MPSERSATENDIFNMDSQFICEFLFSAYVRCLMLVFMLEKMQ